MQTSNGESKNEKITFLEPYVRALQNASSLDENEAKLCVYYCILTHKMDILTIFAILTLFGQHGTGKSSLMKIMAQLVHKPNPNGESMKDLTKWQALKMSDTYASLRDGLICGTTSFIEEGEAGSRKNEQLLADRHSRQTAVVRFKEEQPVGFRQGKADTFGATIIHKRRGYRDPATASRSIFIKTKPEPSKPHSDTIFTPKQRDAFKKMAEAATILPIQSGTRAHELWYPLMGLAIELGDIEWTMWAQKQLEKQLKSQSSGGSYDPQQAIILGILGLVVVDQGNGTLLFLPGKYDLKSIQSQMEQKLGMNLSINEIEFGLLQQGFAVKKRKGEPRVEVTKEKLKNACLELNIDDEALSTLD